MCSDHELNSTSVVLKHWRESPLALGPGLGTVGLRNTFPLIVGLAGKSPDFLDWSDASLDMGDPGASSENDRWRENRHPTSGLAFAHANIATS